MIVREAPSNLIGLAAGLVVLVVFVLLCWLATSGQLDRWPDRIAVPVLAAGGVLLLTGAAVLWATLPAGWRW